jgi:hypothetical protein
LEKQSLVNREIDDEIQARSDGGRQRQSGEKISIVPSHTVILRKNMVEIFVVPHCEAWLSLLTRRKSSISRSAQRPFADTLLKMNSPPRIINLSRFACLGSGSDRVQRNDSQSSPGLHIGRTLCEFARLALMDENLAG